MRVAELMRRDFLALEKDTRLTDALEYMEDYKTSRIVVLSRGKPVGIVTERDIMIKLGSRRVNVPTSHIYLSSCMTINPITISQDAHVSEAADKMLKKHISSLPVVDESGSLVGLLTKEDFLKLCFEIDDIPVERYMSRNPKTISPYARAVEARDILMRHDFSQLIVSERGYPLGLVSEMDIARAFAELREKVPWKLIDSRIKNVLVRDVMDRNLPKVRPDEPLSSAAKKMAEERARALAVVDDDGKVVGIITRTDMVRAVLDRYCKRTSS